MAPTYFNARLSAAAGLRRLRRIADEDETAPIEPVVHPPQTFHPAPSAPVVPTVSAAGGIFNRARLPRSLQGGDVSNRRVAVGRTDNQYIKPFIPKGRDGVISQGMYLILLCSYSDRVAFQTGMLQFMGQMTTSSGLIRTTPVWQGLARKGVFATAGLQDQHLHERPPEHQRPRHRLQRPGQLQRAGPRAAQLDRLPHSRRPLHHGQGVLGHEVPPRGRIRLQRSLWRRPRGTTVLRPCVLGCTVPNVCIG